MTNRYLLSIIILLFTNSILSAQMQSGGLPLGLSQPELLLPAPLLSVAGPDVAALRKADERNPSNRFAAPVEVDVDINSHGNWTLLDDGTQVWQLRLRVPEAQGLLLFYEDFNLPLGAKMFVYSPSTNQVMGAYTGQTRHRTDRLFTGIIYGEEVIVEYQAPADNFTVPFHIWRVDVVYKDDGPDKDLLNFGFGSSSDCHDNVACPEADEWQNERNAAARIIVVVEEGSGYCTGTLVNNTAQDGRLLFLSAFHCMDTYTPIYDLWRFDFYYASSDCENPAEEPEFRSVLGCDSLAGRRAMDFLLLDLYTETTIGMEFHFAGWDRSGVAPDSSAIIHHPRGDIQKIGQANTTATIFPNQITWSNGVVTPPNHHYRVTYTNGTTEVGSSGGALLDKHHRIVGQLHGDAGTTTCDGTIAYFGRLSMAWEGPDMGSRLKEWLDPLGLLPMQLDALGGLRSALVTTDDNEPVANVGVDFYVDDQFIATTYTGTDGRLAIPQDMPTSGNLRMEFAKEGSYSNGVTITDLIKMQKHILGTELMSSYKLLACDVNNSNSLTTLDMIRIRKLILTLTPDFGSGSVASWQFFSADHTFPDPLNPWFPAPRNNIFNFNMETGFRLPDFIAVKSGDANGNASVD
ncbi:MAG: hypothetical protein ACRBG0_10440 [Lewinella sp.]|uniref:hypothetical protein n=1 Tax=Lewinella sp. TaxID=2004506 RepID=UPI003D6A1AB3